MGYLSNSSLSYTGRRKATLYDFPGQRCSEVVHHCLPACHDPSCPCHDPIISCRPPSQILTWAHTTYLLRSDDWASLGGRGGCEKCREAFLIPVTMNAR